MTRRPPSVCDSVPDQIRFLRAPVAVLLDHGTEHDVTRMTIPAYGVRSSEYHVVSHPGYANAILEGRDSFEQYSSVRHALPAVDEGYLSDEDDTWQPRRRAFERAFSGRSFRAFVAAMEVQILRDVGNLDTGVQYRVDKLMRSLLIRATTRAVAGEPPDPAVTARLSEAVDAALRKTSFGYGTVLPVWLPTPSFVSFWVDFHALRGWTDAIAADLPADSIAHAIREAGDLEEDDLSRIVQLLIVAGFVSPSVMTTNAVSLLVDNPGYGDSLVARLGPRAGARSLSGLRNHPDGLRWTLFESLRLFPPTFNLTRRVTTDGATIGPYEVEAGDLVWIDQWSLGRDEEYWSHPNTFAPERWASLRTDRPAFLPFGTGPRECFGKHVALLVGELILANLFGRYRIADAETNLDVSSVSGGASLSLESPSLRLTDRPGEARAH